MEMSSKNYIKSILLFLVMLYPILPLNYYVGGLSYTNICSLAIVVLYFAGWRCLKIVNVFRYHLFFWIYLLVYAMFCFATASMMTGIAWIVLTFMVTIVLIQMIQTEKDFHLVLDMIIYASMILSLIGIAETVTTTYFFQSDLMEGWVDSFRYGIMRCTGPFGHPINFSLFQAIAALMAFYRINAGASKNKKNVYFVAYGLSVLSILCAFSRLPLLFFVAAQGLLILAMGARKSVKYIGSALLLVVCGVLALEIAGFGILQILGDFLITFLGMLGIDSGNSETAISFGNRFDLYAWVIEAVGDQYIFGKGIDAQFAYQLYSWFVKTSIEVHYLYIFFKCGLVGMISLILGYIGSLVFLVRRRKCKLKSEKKLSFSTVLLVIFLGYYVVLFGVQETDTTRIYCELIALSVGYYRIYQKEKGVYSIRVQIGEEKNELTL